MSERKIAEKFPKVMELAPGEYFWCRCGRSANQPFCDGAHAGTGLGPMPFIVEKTKRVALCQCKHTATEPFCDGAHAGL